MHEFLIPSSVAEKKRVKLGPEVDFTTNYPQEECDGWCACVLSHIVALCVSGLGTLPATLLAEIDRTSSEHRANVVQKQSHIDTKLSIQDILRSSG